MKERAKMKTLYFEGAGIVPRGDVENCRIRTAFTNKDGQPMYLEMTGFDRAYRFVTDAKGDRKAIQIDGSFGWVDHCFYIKVEDEEKAYLHFPKASPDVNYNFLYSKAEILRFINEQLNGGFDEIVILPDLSGYRVHADDGGYNFGDAFVYNEERTKQAEKIREYFYEKEKERGVKFPCFSIWFDKNILKVRFFDGRGTLEIPDIFAFDFSENKL
jgi:hypothetical protein